MNVLLGAVIFNANATIGASIRDNRANSFMTQSSSATASNRDWSIGNTSYATITLAPRGSVNVTQSALSGAAPTTAMALTTGAHTTQTASAELTNVYINQSASSQRSTGAVTQDRFVRITAPTATFVGSSTVTTSSTVWIEGAPIAGTNATITNPYAFNVASGNSFFGGKIINNAPQNLKAYTVATLPAGVVGDIAYVTDATAPTYLATIVGGGAVITPVFYNGTNWVAH